MISASESTPRATSWLVFSPNRDAVHGMASRMWSLYAAVRGKLTELAPYAAMLVLPGGSVIAFLWWLYRRQRRAAFSVEPIGAGKGAAARLSANRGPVDRAVHFTNSRGCAVDGCHCGRYSEFGAIDSLSFRSWRVFEEMCLGE